MKKVLIADDTKNIRCLLATCLEHEGFIVISVENGVDALEAFRTNVFDLAFLDIKMPKTSGTEVLRQIRELGIQTPVIIITAFATIKNAVECTQMGAVAYLQKPFTTNRIKQVLAEITEIQHQNTSVENLLASCNEKIALRDFESALTILKKALSLDPSNGQIYALLSQTYGLLGNTADAKKFADIHKVFEGQD